MTLREATPNDLEIIGALIKGLAEYEQLSHEVEWTIENLGSALFGAGSTTRVTLAIDERSGEVAGFALWYPTFSTFRGDRGILIRNAQQHLLRGDLLEECDCVFVAGNDNW